MHGNIFQLGVLRGLRRLVAEIVYRVAQYVLSGIAGAFALACAFIYILWVYPALDRFAKALGAN